MQPITLVMVTPSKSFGRTEKPDYRAKRKAIGNAQGERVVWTITVRDAEELIRVVKENDSEARLQFTDEKDDEGRDVVIAVFPNKTTAVLPPPPPGPPTTP